MSHDLSELEGKFPQLEIIDHRIKDPDGKTVWAGQMVYQVCNKFSLWPDPLFEASAEWCAQNNIPMIHD